VSGQQSALWNPDADGDGCVTMSDVLSLISVFTACSDWGVMDGPDSADSVPWNPDANGDGCVTMSDLLSLMGVFTLCSNWGTVEGPDSLEFTCSDPLDFDNYAYQTVLIGSQCWFAENLRTTTYASGDLIPAGLTDDEWVSTTSGATAVYGEGISYCDHGSPDIDACDEVQSLAAYGRLYNWYAVDDVRGLCPAGWHVPTDDEWTELEDYITSQGFDGTEGTALKSTAGWHNNGHGTDDFGFSALPGGRRNHANVGGFYNAGTYGYWWSSSPDGGNAWRRYLSYLNPVISRNNNNPRFGFSVRCLRDAE